MREEAAVERWAQELAARASASELPCGALLLQLPSWTLMMQLLVLGFRSCGPWLPCVAIPVSLHACRDSWAYALQGPHAAGLLSLHCVMWLILYCRAPCRLAMISHYGCNIATLRLVAAGRRPAPCQCCCRSTANNKVPAVHRPGDHTAVRGGSGHFILPIPCHAVLPLRAGSQDLQLWQGVRSWCCQQWGNLCVQRWHCGQHSHIGSRRV